jgi:hypothetical protein
VLSTAAIATAEHELRAVAELARQLDSELVAMLTSCGAVITAAGVRLGVTAAPTPPKPTAKAITLKDGTEAWYVPFGADVPDGVGHVLELGVSYEIRTREVATPEQIISLLH